MVFLEERFDNVFILETEVIWWSVLFRVIPGLCRYGGGLIWQKFSSQNSLRNFKKYPLYCLLALCLLQLWGVTHWRSHITVIMT